MPSSPHIRVRPELEEAVKRLSEITGLKRDAVRNLALALGLHSLITSLKMGLKPRLWRELYVSELKYIAENLGMDLRELIPSGKVYGVDIESVEIADLTESGKRKLVKPGSGESGGGEKRAHHT